MPICEADHTPKKNNSNFCKILSKPPKNSLKSGDRRNCTNLSHVLCHDKNGLELTFIGSLPNLILSYDLSPPKKVFLATLYRLSQGKFGQEHGHKINLTNGEIASWSRGAFSMQQVRRHLEDLAHEGLIQISYKGNTRWIDVSLFSERKKRIPIIGGQGDKNLNRTHELVLSLLLNKAAFFARAALDFAIGKQSIEALSKDLALHPKTILRALNKLKDEGLIFFRSANQKEVISIVFNAKLEKNYRKLISLKTSAQCQTIMKSRAIQQVIDNLPSELKEELKKNGKRNKRGTIESPRAQVANPVAKKSRLEAQGQNQACHKNPKTRFNLNLTKDQINKILVGTGLWENGQNAPNPTDRKDVSHRQNLDRKDFPHSDFWTQKTFPTGANAHSNAVCDPLFTIYKFTKNKFTRQASLSEIQKQTNGNFEFGTPILKRSIYEDLNDRK